MTDVEKQILKNQAFMILAVNELFIMQKDYAYNKSAVRANAMNCMRYDETIKLLELED